MNKTSDENTVPMVIQCPGCGTKFSIESEEFEGARNPSFHCSRCNRLFDLRGKRRTRTEEVEFTVKKEGGKKEGGENKQLELLSDKMFEEDYSWESHSQLLSHRPSGVREGKISIADDEESNLPLITAEWPDSRTDKEVAVNLSDVTKRSTPFVKTLVEPTPLLTPSPAPALSEDLERFLKQSKEEEERLSSERQALFNRLESGDRNSSSSGRWKFEDDLLRGAVVQFPTFGPGRVPMERIELTSEPKLRRSLPKITTAGFSNIALALSAPLIFAAAFGLIGQTDIVYSLAKVSATSIPRVPPTGVEVQSLASAIKTFNDGKQALEIQGKVLNSTPKAYSNLQLVVRAFDSRNQKLAELIIPAANGLQHTEALNSLKSEIAIRLQGERSLAQALTTSQSQPFRAVIPIQDQVPAYYDAEIYSVESTSL